MHGTAASISVIVPMWNAERTIGEAIESVLDQTVSPQELLVVDNDSTDGSIRAARTASPLIRVLHEPRRSPAAARNCGIQHATGELIAFLDADDRMPNDRLEMQSAALGDSPETAMVFGQQLFFADGDRPWQRPPASWSPKSIKIGMTAGAMMCRRSVFEHVGVFDDRLGSGELLEWFARGQDAGIGAVVPPKVVLFRRIHGNNLTSDGAATWAHAARALKQILDRRRRPAIHAK